MPSTLCLVLMVNMEIYLQVPSRPRWKRSSLKYLMMSQQTLEMRNLLSVPSMVYTTSPSASAVVGGEVFDARFKTVSTTATGMGCVKMACACALQAMREKDVN